MRSVAPGLLMRIAALISIAGVLLLLATPAPAGMVDRQAQGRAAVGSLTRTGATAFRIDARNLVSPRVRNYIFHKVYGTDFGAITVG